MSNPEENARRSQPPHASPLNNLVKHAGTALVLTFCFLATGIIGAGVYYYQAQERRLRGEAEQHLASIATLKVFQLDHWRRERMADAAEFFKNPLFTTLIKRYFEKPEEAESQRQLQLWFNKILPGYNRVCLYDAQGDARLSSPDGSGASDSDFRKSSAEAMRTRQIVFEDFYRDEHDRRVYLSLLIPILDEQDGSRVIGILSMRIDPSTYLYPFIQHWPVPSETAETLLVRRDGNAALFLNDLRFKKNAALIFSFPLTQHSLPAVKAVTGYEGLCEGSDYRDIPVLAAVRAIPGSPWFLVAKKDVAEVSAPLREQLEMTLFLVAAMVVISGLAVTLIWRNHKIKVYKDKLEVSEALEKEHGLFSTLMDNLPDKIYFKDALGHYLHLNPATVRALNANNMSEITGKSDAEFYPESLARQFQAEEEEVMRSGQPMLDVEMKRTWPDGTVTWSQVSKLPLRDGAGRIIGTCGISSNITGRKLAEETLQKTELELLKKNEELERFLYTASHDLKSPLVTIKTFLGYLEQDMASADAAQIGKDMHYIGTAAEKMAMLLDELLEMSRVGRVVNPPVRISFRALVNDALAAVAGRIAAGEVSVTVQETDVMLHGDRVRLAEIWQNLLDNACKFMGEQKEPRIKIGVGMRDGERVFFVQDNGSGIDPRYQSKVFSLFEKLNPAAEGTGIGLTHVSRIVDIYGGRIWVESGGPGQGSNFLFTLPGAGNTDLQAELIKL